jgi:hypothetical protein
LATSKQAIQSQHAYAANAAGPESTVNHPICGTAPDFFPDACARRTVYHLSTDYFLNDRRNRNWHVLLFLDAVRDASISEIGVGDQWAMP